MKKNEKKYHIILNYINNYKYDMGLMDTDDFKVEYSDDTIPCINKYSRCKQLSAEIFPAKNINVNNKPYDDITNLTRNEMENIFLSQDDNDFEMMLKNINIKKEFKNNKLVPHYHVHLDNCRVNIYIRKKQSIFNVNNFYKFDFSKWVNYIVNSGWERGKEIFFNHFSNHYAECVFVSLIITDNIIFPPEMLSTCHDNKFDKFDKFDKFVIFQKITKYFEIINNLYAKYEAVNYIFCGMLDYILNNFSDNDILDIIEQNITIIHKNKNLYDKCLQALKSINVELSSDILLNIYYLNDDHVLMRQIIKDDYIDKLIFTDYDKEIISKIFKNYINMKSGYIANTSNDVNKCVLFYKHSHEYTGGMTYYISTDAAEISIYFKNRRFYDVIKYIVEILYDNPLIMNLCEYYYLAQVFELNVE